MTPLDGGTARITPLRRGPVDLAPGERRVVDRWLDDNRDNEACVAVDSPLAEPWRFLTFLGDEHGLVFHGSDRRDLDVLIPAEHDRGDLTDFGNATQVFASPDALWAMWFAVMDRGMPFGAGTANGCTRTIHDGAVSAEYWFAIAHGNVAAGRVTASGAIYICNPEPFVDRNGEEWGSPGPVVPIARVDVEPGQWPFSDAVLGYDADRLRARIDEDPAGFPWFDDLTLWPIVPDAYRAG